MKEVKYKIPKQASARKENQNKMSAVETKPNVDAILRSPIGTGPNLSALIGNYKKSFEAIAPKLMDVPRMLRIALMAISRNPALMECTGSSVLGALMLSTQMGLDIGAGESHLVPFWNTKVKPSVREVQLIPDFKGIAKLIRNTGIVKNCRAHVVYRQDVFEYEEGANQKLIHKPNLDHEFNNEDIIGAYNVAVFEDGYLDIHFVSRRYLLAVKARSKASSGPWHGTGDQRFDFAEMCRKTALKNHSKTLPRSVELAQAIALDQRAELAAPQNISLTADPTSGLLVADMTAEDPEPEDRQQLETEAGKSAIDRIVEQSKKPDSGNTVKKAASVTQSEQKSEVTAASPLPDTKTTKQDPTKHWTENKATAVPNPGQGDETSKGPVEPPQAAEIDPNSGLTEAQFEELGLLRLDHDIETKVWLAFVKGPMGYRMTKDIKLKDFARAKAWIEAGGKE